MCNQTISEDRKMANKRKITDDLQTKENVKRVKMSSFYSNNLADSVRIFCCECDKVVNLSELKEHLMAHHKMTIKEYKQLYGCPQRQIIQQVLHKCGLCTKEVLLDNKIIKSHLKSIHQSEYTAYSNKFLAAAKEEKKVIIKCMECGKTFKRNKQLKAHSKRHQMEFMGFSSREVEKKVNCFDKLIRMMETSLHRDKQAFQQLLRLTY